MEDRRRLGSPGWALVAILGGTFMLLVDVTIVQVALPSIERDLHAGFAGLQWVIDAYALTLAALLLWIAAVNTFNRLNVPTRQVAGAWG